MKCTPYTTQHALYNYIIQHISYIIHYTAHISYNTLYSTQHISYII